MNHKYNLNTRKITEFTTEDTIYIEDKDDHRGLVFLCQFLSYDGNKREVTGKVIGVDDPKEDFKIGKVLVNKLHRCCLYGNSTDKVNRPYYRFFDSSLYALHPLEEHKIVENDLHIEKHPSFGLLSFSRQNSSHGVSLFGTSIQNKQTICLVLKRARHDRNLNNDWYHASSQIVEVEMSQSQFAELITTFNMGEGVPCTIRSLNGDRYPDPTFISKTDIFHGEFKKGMQNHAIEIKKLVEQTNEILGKATIGKGDREIIKNNIFQVVRYIDDHIPFIAKQFSESMEKTVIEAKGEIEAFVEQKIRSAGLEKLGFTKEENTPLIENSKK